MVSAIWLENEKTYQTPTTMGIVGLIPPDELLSLVEVDR